MKKQHIVIAGGGLGGLTAACRLARDGHKVDLFERSQTLSTASGAIFVRSNGVRCFYRWQMREAFETVTAPIKEHETRNGNTNKLLHTLNPGVYSEFPEWPTDRQALQTVLYDEACEAGAKVHFGKEIVAIEEDDQVAYATCKGGTRVTADLILAADGISSRLRSQVLSHVDPSRLTVIRAPSTHYPTEIPAEMLTNDDRTKSLCQQPKSENGVMWAGHGGYAIGNQRKKLFDATDDTYVVKSFFSSFNPTVVALANMVQSCSRWRLARLEPLDTWSSPKRRLVLLGDSAHAMLPNLAEGFSSIVEDIDALSILLSESSWDMPKTIETWEEIRIPRVTRLQNGSTWNYKLYNSGKPRGDGNAPFNTLPFDKWMFDYDTAKEELACKAITVIPGLHEPSIGDAQHEYHVLRSLQHPNIVQYVDFETTNDEARIYMELCGGGNLKDYIKERSSMPNPHLPESTLWDVITQLSSALTYCHFGWNPIVGDTASSTVPRPNFRTVLHRDLKPANVFVSSANNLLTVKLGDFGLAKFLDLEHTISTFVGTRAYLAPEIINHEATGDIRWSRRSDIYSLGCLVYEISTLRLLPESPAADVRLIPSHYSNSLKSFVARCLSEDPSQRPDAPQVFEWASACYMNIRRVHDPSPSSFQNADASFDASEIDDVLQQDDPTHHLSPGPIIERIDHHSNSSHTEDQEKVAIIPLAEESLFEENFEAKNLLRWGGFQVSDSSFSKEVAFNWATRHGIWNAMEYLIEQGIDIETYVPFVDSSGDQIETYLQHGRQAHGRVLQALAQLEIEVNGMTPFLLTALHHAILQGNIEIARYLLQKGADIDAAAKLDAEDAVLMSTLALAVLIGDESSIELLLEAGADCSLSFGRDELSPLLAAVATDCSEHIVELLLQHGAASCPLDDGWPAYLSALMEAKNEGVTVLILNCMEGDLGFSLPVGMNKLLGLLLCSSIETKDYRVVQILLDWNVSREETQSEDRTPLLVAAGNGDMQSMQLLLDKGVNTNAKDEDGSSALHLVVKGDYNGRTKLDAIELLLGHGVAMDSLDNRKRTPFIWAACDGSPSGWEIVQLLQQLGANVQAQGTRGESALMLASRHGSLDTMSFLLDNGAKVSAQDLKGHTAIHYAIWAEDQQEDRLKMLHEHGAEMGASATNPILHYAAQYCTSKTLQQLLQLYPSASDLLAQRDKDGWSPLEIVAWNGKRDRMELIMKHGIHLDEEAQSHVLHYAIRGGKLDCIHFAISAFPITVSRLYHHPAGDKWPGSWRPIHYAASLGKLEVVRLIIEHGADPEALDSSENTAFVHAIRADHIAVAEELLKMRSDMVSRTSKLYYDFVKQEDRSDEPPGLLKPIHYAAMNGATKGLEFILDSGVDIDDASEDARGYTALHFAIANEQEIMVNALLRRGADMNRMSKEPPETPLLQALRLRQESIACWLVFFGARTSWLQPDGTMQTALNVAVEEECLDTFSWILSRDKSLLHISGAVMDPHLQRERSVSRIVAEDDVPIALVDEHSNMNGDTGAMKGSITIEPDTFTNALVAAIRSQDSDVLGQLITYANERKNGGGLLEPLSRLICQDGLAAIVEAAAQREEFDDVELLVEICDWNIDFEVEEMLPIHIGAYFGYKDFVEALLSRPTTEIDQELADGSHRTALSIATQEGYADIVKLLLDHGADVERCDGIGATPLQRAIDEQHADVVKVLLEHGADIHKRAEGSLSVLSLAAARGQEHVVRMLLKAGADINGCASDQAGPPLYYAAMANCHDILRLLLDSGADVNNRGPGGQTALILAVGRDDGEYDEESTQTESEDERMLPEPTRFDDDGDDGIDETLDDDLKTVVILLERGADPEIFSDNHWNALQLASHQGRTPIVEALLKHGANVNAEDIDGYVALHFAAIEDHQEMVQLLLRHKADANAAATGIDGQTPLHEAACRGHALTAETLIKHGARVNAADNNGDTPLHWAAREGQALIAELLIQKGAKLEARNTHNGSSPMHLAASGGKVAVIQVLQYHGADTTATNDRKATPLKLAAQSGHLGSVKLILQSNKTNRSRSADVDMAALHVAVDEEDEEVLQALLEHGANPNIYPPSVNQGKKSGMCSKRSNPLHSAARSGWVKGMEILIQHGADVNANCITSGTPLHSAGLVGQVKAVSLLLAHGARIDIWDGQRSPLHRAVISGRAEVVRMLLEHGADLNERDVHGFTPMDLAKQEPRCDEVIHILKEAGKSRMKPLHWLKHQVVKKVGRNPLGLFQRVAPRPLPLSQLMSQARNITN
ncbi:salicylate hydroxylase [Fusarium napiforme]|uniref:Salicylate hydroxylase n=1 Tax=Fusarium napiforme TaxID=42672 RepID=A0A8H5NDQ4_9HYPO|nr:salicylate hydroxylase [Fusarium napiforme]